MNRSQRVRFTKMFSDTLPNGTVNGGDGDGNSSVGIILALIIILNILMIIRKIIKIEKVQNN